jgi:hypothetical protein
MRMNWRTALHSIMAIVLSVTVLAGCGANLASANYPLESVTQDGDQLSRVYRAENKTVPEVAHELADQKTPQEMSKEDPDRMFLIYPDELYHLQKDPNKPADTLIEVDNREFVRQNYDSSFLQGYLLASVLDDLFDSLKGHHGKYRGYSTRDVYRPVVVYHAPTDKEKKQYPPITREGVGSIIKRSSSGSGAGTSLGSDGSLTKKEKGTTDSGGFFGKIFRSSDSPSSGGSDSGGSLFSRPKSKSPPKIRVGGFGRLTKRR